MSPLIHVFAIGICHVVDGDSLRCGTERVRLLRIDAVERGEPGYDAARDHLATLIDGSKVYCVTRARDRYHRLLGECASDRAASLGDDMLATGFARKYRR